MLLTNEFWLTVVSVHKIDQMLRACLDLMFSSVSVLVDSYIFLCGRIYRYYYYLPCCVRIIIIII